MNVQRNNRFFIALYSVPNIRKCLKKMLVSINSLFFKVLDIKILTNFCQNTEYRNHSHIFYIYLLTRYLNNIKLMITLGYKGLGNLLDGHCSLCLWAADQGPTSHEVSSGVIMVTKTTTKCGKCIS